MERDHSGWGFVDWQLRGRGFESPQLHGRQMWRNLRSGLGFRRVRVQGATVALHCFRWSSWSRSWLRAIIAPQRSQIGPHHTMASLAIQSVLARLCGIGQASRCDSRSTPRTLTPTDASRMAVHIERTQGHLGCLCRLDPAGHIACGHHQRNSPKYLQ